MRNDCFHRTDSNRLFSTSFRDNIFRFLAVLTIIYGPSVKDANFLGKTNDKILHFVVIYRLASLIKEGIPTDLNDLVA